MRHRRCNACGKRTDRLFLRTMGTRGREFWCEDCMDAYPGFADPPQRPDRGKGWVWFGVVVVALLLGFLAFKLRGR